MSTYSLPVNRARFGRRAKGHPFDYRKIGESWSDLITGRAILQMQGELADQSGFTMVELIVTMVIVGILAVIVLPRLNLLKGFDEIGYRDKVRATLEFARKSAVAQRRNVCVTLAGNGLTLTRDVRDPDANAADCTSEPTPNINRLQLPTPDAAYCGGATTGNEICRPGNVTLAGPVALTFNPLGRPSAAAVYTVTGEAPTLSTYTITVEAETGYVH